MLERAEVGAVWASRYDRLHLHTVRWLSGLPGYGIPRRFGKWPARDRVAEYLALYAAFHQLDVRTGVEVERVEREGDGWVVRTSTGPLSTDRVVIATGLSNVPFMPDWPGAAGGRDRPLRGLPQRLAVPRPPRSRRRHRQLGCRDRGRPGRGRRERGAAVGADASGHRPARHARRPEPAVRDRELASADGRRRPDRGRDPPGCDPRSRVARPARSRHVPTRRSSSGG